MIGKTLGQYHIVDKLGAGGMGEVYRARDLRLGRDVAVKMLPPQLSGEPVARERLRREAMAAAALDHPFICKIFEIGEDASDDQPTPGVLYIVMEFVRGETLQAHLASGPLPPGEALRMGVEIAEALEAAHARQIVHRDLKPGNVILSTQGHAKVMDFGLAKDLSIDGAAETRTLGQVHAALTGAGERVGTLAYMSPEQIAGDPVDARSDIFALGVLLCEMVSGTHPFLRPTMAATLSAVLQDSPVYVSPSGSGVPAAIRQVLQRALAKSPVDRYQTMAEFRRDLASLSPSGAVAFVGLGAPPPDRAGQTRAWPMIGRDAERDELVAALDRAAAGHGSMVVIGGEPGIGKTRLTEAVVSEAARRGCLCLVGHSYEMEGAPPYVSFVEILEQAARLVPAGAFRHALGERAPEMAKLMPELRRMFPDLPPALEVPPEQQRWLLFNAYRDFVFRAGDMSPTVLVLEDLHWADEPTLQLLLHLSPAIAAHPILVVGTYRDVELNVTRPFANVLEALLRERRAARITLRRLHQSGVGQMLEAMSGRPAPRSLAEVVHRETEGNPFFVEEVFQHLSECGQVFDSSGNWRKDLRVESLDVPESVRLVIGRRLERLGETARRVLTTAAVVGRSFSLALLESLESDAPDAVIDAVEEAERAHLIAPQRAGREARYQFAHELIRQTLAEALSMPRRQRLHLRVAEAIEARYAGSLEQHTSTLAHHLYQAGAAADPEKTTQCLVAAATEATAAAAHEDALRHIENALSLWEGERSPRVADLAERRGRTLRSLGRPHEAIYALHRAVDLWDAGTHPERLVVAALALLGAYAWQAEAEAGLEAADAVLARLDTASPAARFPLVQMRAVLLALSGRIDEALQQYAAATSLREQARSAQLDAMALSVEPHFRWIVSDLESAAAASRAAAAALDAAGQRWMAVDVAWVAPFSEYFLGRMAAPTDIDGMIARAGQVGHAGARSTLLQVRTALALSAGDLDAAEAFARESAELSRESSNRWGYFSMLLHGLITLERGKIEDGLAVLQDALTWEPESYWVRYGHWTRFLALAQAAPADALAVWGALPVRLPHVGAANPLGAWGNLSHVVMALALLGRRDQVAPLEPLTEAQVAAGFVWPMWMSLGRTVAGVASGCAGHWDAADAHFRAAIALADEAPHRHAQPDARYWHADMLIQRAAPGDRERARQLLEEASAQADAIGLVLTGRRIHALAERAGL